MASLRDLFGRFVSKVAEVLSPAYRRRVERGEERGKSRSEARGHGRTPIKQWESRAVLDREAYDRTLEVLSRMRAGESLTRATREAQTTPDTVLRYGGS